MTKRITIDTTDMSPVEVYKLVLAGKLKNFPKYYWERPESINSAKEITIYLIEHILQWNDEEIKTNLSKEAFNNHSLTGMLSIVFRYSLYEAIDTAYPGRFNPWEVRHFPKGYWNIETGIKATKWLVETKLELGSDKEVKDKLSKRTFKDNGLGAMLYSVFANSPYQALNLAYPNRFMPWEFKLIPHGDWDLESAVKATKWLVEELLNWSDEEIKTKLDTKTFLDNRLGGMLRSIFNCSAYRAIDALYPGRFEPWELICCPKNYWCLETAISATKFLIEKKLNWDDEDIKEKLSEKTFRDNGLLGMMHFFQRSPYQAINAAYPGRFMPWELRSCSRNYWNLETGINATKWLVEKKLKLSQEDIRTKLSRKAFYENGLRGMLGKVFQGSMSKAIDSAYPN